MDSDSNYISKVYDLNGHGWKCYKVEELNEKQCKKISTKCTKQSRCDRLKAVGWATLGVVGTLGVMSVAASVAKLFSLLLAIVLLPIAPIFPIYVIICLGGGLVAGAAFAYFAMKGIWSKVGPIVGDYWKEANHYSKQADLCQDRVIDLTRAAS